MSPLQYSHERGCPHLVAATCAVPIECEHGRDVCPTCDPCTCSRIRARAKQLGGAGELELPRPATGAIMPPRELLDPEAEAMAANHERFAAACLEHLGEGWRCVVATWDPEQNPHVSSNVHPDELGLAVAMLGLTVMEGTEGLARALLTLSGQDLEALLAHLRRHLARGGVH